MESKLSFSSNSCLRLPGTAGATLVAAIESEPVAMRRVGVIPTPHGGSAPHQLSALAKAFHGSNLDFGAGTGSPEASRLPVTNPANFLAPWS